MILAVGVDIVEVERIRRAMRRPRFIERILTEREREVCQGAQCLAGRWAAKEAVVKVFGRQFGWHTVEILSRENQAPRVEVHHGRFDPQKHKVHVSISHESAFAVAVAILEQI